MSTTQLATLDKERHARRAKLTVALREDEDPLAVYDDFIKWTITNYPPDLIPRSGLLEILEEAGREFKDDKTYQGDRRYLKLWLTYAQYVDNDIEGPAAEIYKHLIRNNVGTAYAQLYEDYAASLERFDRRQDADKVYRHGIQKRARPVERLKQSYEQFQTRTDRTQRAPPTCPVPSSAWKTAPREAQLLRRYPLKNWSRSGKSSTAQAATSSSSSTVPAIQDAVASSIQKYGHDRYAPMLAPSSGAHKKPEQLRFNLSLLFTEDGTEYCREEARAKSMGLLGKKWPIIPISTGASSSSHTGKQGGNTTKKVYSEPTVTIATKEALADVFGMYNSPDRTLRFGTAGSKYAPVHKVEPMAQLKPVVSKKSENDPAANKKQASFQPFADENSRSLGKSGFRPFVDENEDHGKLKNSNHPSAEFRIFQDAPTPPPKENAPSTSRARVALSKKESVVARSSPELGKEEHKASPMEKEKEKEPNIFLPIFTPVASAEHRPSALAKKGSPVSSTPPAPQFKFKPFVDSNADAEASKPPAPIPNIFTRTPKAGTLLPTAQPLAAKPSFAPFVDNEQPVLAPRTALGERSRSHTPLQEQSTPSTSTDEDGYQEYDMPQAQQQDYYDEYESTDESGYEEAPPSMPPAFTNMGDEEDFEDDDEMGDYEAPMGGRLGRFNVMTPITERTYEFTHTTSGPLSARGTPSDGSRAFTHNSLVAKQSAEQLAAELAQDDDDDFDDVADEDLGQVEEKTGTLSLSDALAAVSSFKPPNPCNPFDPSIISSLLSIIPADPSFQDFRNQESNQLEALQKFSKQKKRRASGNSSRDSAQSGSLAVTLNGRQYNVIDKLGEGGFGAVFEAIDVVAAHEKHGIEDEDDFDLIDEDEIPKVALKVVKPRNLWEFHVLRRIHQALPARLKQSVIVPETLYTFRDESFLVLELLKQGTLLDVVNNAASAGITQQGACLDELLVMFFTIELLRLLEGLHRAGFIHGDVKIDNCLLRLEDVPGGAPAWASVYQPSGEGGWASKGIKMIDFGRTIDTRMFPSGQRFVGDWAPDARDCLELREGKPWTYQTDYFGLAGIVYCMLYGKYIEASSVTLAPETGGPPRYKLATPFKRYWQGDLWTRLFDMLLNSALVHPDGKLPLCDEIGAIREEMEGWVQANCNRASNSLKGLLKKVDLMTLGGKDGK